MSDETLMDPQDFADRLVDPGVLAAPGPPGLVDVGAHDHLPGVGLLGAGGVQPRPGDVQLGQGSLDEVLRAVPVTAQRVGDAPEVGAAGRDEGDELGLAPVHQGPPVGGATSHPVDGASARRG